jgi:transmembrane sensor
VSELDWTLFDRYLAGELTQVEREQFDNWLSERQDSAAQIAQFSQAINLLANGVSLEERQAMWGRIVGRSSGPTYRSRAVRFLPRSARPQWRTAAGVAVGVLIAAGVALAGRTWLAGGKPSELLGERVVTVPRAQQAQFRLPDSTIVVLHGGSTLRHPKFFSESSREVMLDGEAYFAVEHDPQRPFRVHAGDLVVTDLGTEFLVRAYPEDPRAKVVVRSGEVAVRPSATRDIRRAGTVVGAGELGRLDRHGKPVVEPADTAAYFAWTRGELVFDGTPLREALPQLSRWYDLEFRLADSSLGSIPLSGRLNRTLTDDGLDLLAASLGLRQARTGRVVTFSSLSTVH